MFTNLIYPLTLHLLLLDSTCSNSWISYRSIRQVFQESGESNNMEILSRVSDEISNNSLAKYQENGNTSTKEEFRVRKSDERVDDELNDSTEPGSNLSDDNEMSMSQESAITSTEAIDKQDVQQDLAFSQDSEMEELISLTRNNCNLEIQINEWETRKLMVQYESLKSGVFGQCAITAYGRSDLLLAVFITNVKLNGNAAGDRKATEVLKVITINKNVNFTLKEYRWNEQYYPVILTDSHRVYIILYFNGTTILRNTKTSFHLEVFNYYKNENEVNQNDVNSYAYGSPNKNVENVYITTSSP